MGENLRAPGGSGRRLVAWYDAALLIVVTLSVLCWAADRLVEIDISAPVVLLLLGWTTLPVRWLVDHHPDSR